MKGRKRTPTAKLRLTGNFRKDRRLNEAKIEPHVPGMPSTLDTEAKAEWRRVVKAIGGVGMLADSDRAALAAYCQSWSIMQATLKRLSVDGWTVKSDLGHVSRNPDATTFREQQQSFIRMATELGLTPAARSKVQVIGKPKEKNPLEALKNRKHG